MAHSIPLRPRFTSQTKSKIAIVASKFNKEYVDALIDATIAELGEVIPDAVVQIVRVPGALEIPTTMKYLATQQKGFHCFIALGLVFQGETAHADVVTQTSSKALMDVSLELNKPVINEILHVLNEDQAKERCMGNEINRGTEAARTAASMISVFSELRKPAN